MSTARQPWNGASLKCPSCGAYNGEEEQPVRVINRDMVNPDYDRYGCECGHRFTGAERPCAYRAADSFIDLRTDGDRFRDNWDPKRDKP